LRLLVDVLDTKYAAYWWT